MTRWFVRSLTLISFLQILYVNKKVFVTHGFFWDFSGLGTRRIQLWLINFLFRFNMILCLRRERSSFFLDFQIHTNPCPVMNNPLLIGQGCPTVWNTLPWMWWYDHWKSTALNVLGRALISRAESPLHRRYFRRWVCWLQGSTVRMVVPNQHTAR